MDGTVSPSIWGELAAIFTSGGFVMPPLALLSVLLWLGLGYRFFTLRRGSSEPTRELVDQAMRGVLKRSGGYVVTAAIVAADIRRGVRGSIDRVLEEQLFFIGASLGRYRTLVRTIVMVAPLAGLLGTVSGMIEMFRSLGDQTFYSQSGGVANGISQALLTTQFGLMIAIPGMIVGRLMDRREDGMRNEIEQIRELVATLEDPIGRNRTA